MKIIHTADWHLGHNFFRQEREREHEHFLRWLGRVTEEQSADVLLLAGDIFDMSNPSVRATGQFYRFLSRILKRMPRLQLIAIAGNHDSGSRIELPNTFFKMLTDRQRLHIIGCVPKTPEGKPDYAPLLIPLYDASGEKQGFCMAVPYLRPGDYALSLSSGEGQAGFLNEAVDYARRHCENLPLVLLGHFYAAGSDVAKDNSEGILPERIGGQDCVPLGHWSEGLCYAALGHIHKQQRLGPSKNICYSGSVLKMNFGESHYRQGVNLVRWEKKGEAQIERLEYEPLQTLCSVPEKPLPLQEVLKRLADLPDKQPSETGEGRRPAFLEVNISLDEPRPNLRQLVENALSNKAVRLCSIKTSYKGGEEPDPDTASDLYCKTLSPGELLEELYEKQFKNPLPRPLYDLFHEVLGELREEDGEAAAQ